MKKKLLTILTMLMLLSIVVSAEEQIVDSTLGVNSFVSVTITPCADPLDFGSGNPNEELAISCQGVGVPAVNISNDLVSNANINVSTLGNNFVDGGNSIAIGNFEFDENNTQGSTTALTTSYQQSSVGVAPDTSVGIWYWGTIPAGQNAGSYVGNFTIEGIEE